MTHNTPKISRAFVGTVASALAFGAVNAPISSASADRPEHASRTVTSISNTLCDFPVTVTSQQTGFIITSADGSTLFFHIVEQDSFSANGRTLTSLPYTSNGHLNYGADGSIASYSATGVLMRVPISEGVTFRAAGRLDFLNGNGDSFLWLPDSGGSQNQDAFCSALAP
jgi:hypothetical protein